MICALLSIQTYIFNWKTVPSMPMPLNITNKAKMSSQNYCGDEAPVDIKLVTDQNGKRLIITIKFKTYLSYCVHLSYPFYLK